MLTLRFGAAAAIAAAALFACGGDKPSEGGGGQPKKPEAPAYKVQHDEAALAKAKTEVYDRICWTCHGKSGHGDGPAGAALDPKPRTFDDPVFHKRVEKKGGLSYIKKVIIEGGQAVGLSAAMTPHTTEQWPALADDKVLTELAKYVIYDLGGYKKELK